ncbi:fanconi-associated nuclease 1-like [Daktulosphaira vitifoliae]|uniref:fanconi-associated nuclease 1-like n=1 Tax=Daktulosphaira vitifoliae TaxID=58002 RepID=UPI0021AA73A0|nr:fanconi-associated nuclease 1-like [Daktulosphaira vitifoliae]
MSEFVRLYNKYIYYIFKTPSKSPNSNLITPSSTSPFTPKRSLIRKKIEDFNSVSRVLFDSSDESSSVSVDLKEKFLSTCQIKSETQINNTEQITPIKDLQNQNKILLSPQIKNHPNRFNLNENLNNAIKSKSNKRKGTNLSTSSKKHKIFNADNNKKIYEFFQSSEQILQSENNNKLCNESSLSNKHFMSYNEESIKIKQEFFDGTKVLPETISHLKFMKNSYNTCQKLVNITKISPSKNLENTPTKNNKKTSNFQIEVTPKKKIDSSHINSRSPSIYDLLTQPKIIITGGDTYSRFIRHLVLRPEVHFLVGRHYKLFAECTDEELKIYGRLFLRKHGWIRSNGPNSLQDYKSKNLCDNFELVLQSLEEKELINTNVLSCKLEDLLDKLKVSELRKLQKLFNITSNTNQNKTQIVKSFTDYVKNQRTFCGNSNNNLKERIRTLLGYCVRLSDEPREDLLSCLIIVSYPFFVGEEKDRMGDFLSKFTMKERGEIKYPDFKVQHVSINFTTSESLLSYKKSLFLRQEIQFSNEQKNHENVVSILKIVFDELKSAISNQNTMNTYEKLPTYMRKFTAVSVYTYTLLKNISQLKKFSSENDLTKEVLIFLLDHKEFLISKRINLYIELAKLYEMQYKQLDLAAKVIIEGLKDKVVGELGSQILSNRGMMYAKRKTNGLSPELKLQLLELTILDERKIPEITINGKIVSFKEKGSSGRKQVYEIKTYDGISYMSVEERSLYYYKNEGYSRGLHDEGQLIKSMFFLCFWDVIYGNYPPHVIFLSEYQDSPLDWRTQHFYTIREKAIKDQLAKLEGMSVNEIYEMLNELCVKYYNTQSVINWKILTPNNLLLCKELLNCLGISIFLSIGHHILANGRKYMHGMPDLIIWNPMDNKYKFVEVKGPKDKLSDVQHSWLLTLIEFGAYVEVCHIVGNGGKYIEHSENND